MRIFPPNKLEVVDGGEPREVFHTGNLKITESATDTTANRLLKVGDFGVGVDAGPMLEIADLNSTTSPTGFYRTRSSTPNIEDRPPGDVSPFAFLLVERYDDNQVKQTFTSRSGSAEGQLIWFRTWSNTLGDWAPWSELYHTGNIAFIRDAENNPVAPQFPQGAVIERGANDNGEYVKFADGTLICTKADFQLVFVNSARYTSFWSLPARFINDQYVGFWEFADPGELENRTTARYSGPKVFVQPSAATAQARLYRNANLTSFTDEGSFTCVICAIGRWF